MAMSVSLPVAGQSTWNEVFNKFKLEARADMEYRHQRVTADGSTVGDGTDLYGIHGKYFNLHLGGNLGENFSYYFRQRIKAEAGTVNFFDNTDFLYLNYRPTQNWQLRFGKDAMAVGGFEYDAAPIDVYFETYMWDNFYCFQLAASGAYISDDGKQTLMLQVSQSPYVNYLRYTHNVAIGWDAGLLAYNLYWSGAIGDCVKTLWGVSMMERERGKFLGYICLGTQVLIGDIADIYVDLMHHSLATDDWGKNFGIVSRANYYLNKNLTLFAKGSYERNKSQVDLDNTTGIGMDFLMPDPGHSYARYGVGFEYRPKGLASVRLHGYVAGMTDSYTNAANQDIVEHGLNVNLGATWTMDFHKLFKK